MQNGLAGHRARKRFGQNFLHDEHWIERIARTIGETVVEIGPGPGCAYPGKMIADAGHATAIEIDRDLAAWLKETFPETLTLIEADAFGNWTGMKFILVRLCALSAISLTTFPAPCFFT